MASYPGADLKGLLAAARGDEPADLVLNGGRVADLFGTRLKEAQVAVKDGLIVGLAPPEESPYQGREAMDLAGGVVAPSFIDGHIHLESTLLTPAELTKVLVPLGTGTVVADPHEIANVLGLAGVRWILAASRGLDLEVLLTAPSCVPASPLETSGARLTAADLAPLVAEELVLGLAEVMNYPGLVAGEDDLLAKLEAFRSKVIDGHAPLLSGKALNAYLLAGPGSDHECSSAGEAEEKLARGMRIMIRHGSSGRNLPALAPVVTAANSRRMMLVTDDNHPDRLLGKGHLNHVLAKAVEQGIPPLIALQMVTLNPAEYFKLGRKGAVAPGYAADLVVLEDLERFRALLVFKGGRLVAREGKLVGRPPRPTDPPPPAMKVAPYPLRRLSIPVGPGRTRVISVAPGQLLTKEVRLKPTVRKGEVVADPRRDLAKLVVVERHRGSGNIGLGLVRGFGLKRGALASSVAHDSHNLVGLGVDDEDLYLALKRVESLGGGLAVALEGKITAELPLPLAGLISLAPAEEVVAGLEELEAACSALGCGFNPFMTLAFLSLAVIPSLKLTDLGLVDVDRFELVELFTGHTGQPEDSPKTSSHKSK